ncbi:MAG: Uracil phosphoribosyltransferase, partial [candidate division WS6 bacterium 34_10]
MSNFILLDNPVLKEVGLKLHDIKTKPHEYREYERKLGEYMGIELASRGVVPLKKVETETPLGSLKAKVVDDENIGIVNVLRAGTTMSLGFGDAYPNSCIAFVSAWRREENRMMVADTDYNRGIEDLKNRFVILADPALASGASLLATIEIISDYIEPKNTIICCLHA